MNILKFTTAGSVDDGKSTLIGRLLFDSKSIFDDQYEAVKASSEKRGEEYVNLALLTDGLRAEREQGITIDVAYRYFATPKRKFIIADTPGHVQYTRNMVTGASTANLAIVLIDARKGLSEQTHRHTYIASLLRIPHVIVCINKMDLVAYSENSFNAISNAFQQFASGLGFQTIHTIPISALHGDNVVDASKHIHWYTGPTLLHLLETIPLDQDDAHVPFRFPVQYVIRPMSHTHPDYRGYAGRVAGGSVRVGDAVMVLPSGLQSTVKTIDVAETTRSEATSGQSITITLHDELDVSRGDMLVPTNQQPQVAQEFDVICCWMNEQALRPNGKYLVRHSTREMRCIIKQVIHKLNISTLEPSTSDLLVSANDIARLRIRTMQPLVYDLYSTNRTTGSLILIDEATNETVAAAMVVS